MLVGLRKGKLRRRTTLPWRQNFVCLLVVLVALPLGQFVYLKLKVCPKDHPNLSRSFIVLEDQNPNPVLPGGQREVGQKTRLDLQHRIWTPPAGLDRPSRTVEDIFKTDRWLLLIGQAQSRVQPGPSLRLPGCEDGETR